MLGELFGRFGGCGCEEHAKNSSCDVLWIIILLMIVFRGGAFGLDICTLLILFIVFGGEFFCREKREHKCC